MGHQGPIYHATATGAAKSTVNCHQTPQDLIFWAGWVNPYLKEEHFLAISPKGLVPAIQHHGSPLHDSIVVSEYLEEAFFDDNAASDTILPPSDPYQRGVARIWIDFINKSVVPPFFRLLQAQSDEAEQKAMALQDLKDALAAVSSQVKGPYFFGDQFSLVDAVIAPWAVRDFILREYRGFNREEVLTWKQWAEALESRRSDPEKYVEFNKTFLRKESHSLVGKAALEGRILP
ncbi:hypothetical protein H2204_005815 [Knufia peltigerae]|uniref:GST C-terminal domain-containing protein n=1 Tax=Knufia peltigerae TaxID=1002370 RepID=A0AA38Y5E0_9EURO|nr:hypothetical protein H2204_005815 [Knufia peltigerae]